MAMGMTGDVRANGGSDTGGSSAELAIGEVSRRLGLRPDTIRVWERRYGVVSPRRSAGGARRYSSGDLERLRMMQREISAGMAPSEAARLALEHDRPTATVEPDPHDVDQLTGELMAAVRALDEPRAQNAIDRLLGAFTEDYVLKKVFLPLYFDSVLGRSPGREMEAAEERFVVNVLRGRLLGLARGWGDGTGPIAVLSCPPGEHHDLALLCFGIALRTRGWQILFLGADTPIGAVRDVARWLEPDFVLVAASDRALIEAISDELGELGREAPLAVVGQGLRQADAAAMGARLVRNEPVTAATLLAAGNPP